MANHGVKVNKSALPGNSALRVLATLCHRSFSSVWSDSAFLCEQTFGGILSFQPVSNDSVDQYGTHNKNIKVQAFQEWCGS